APVDRVVECLPDTNVVERGTVRVQRCEVDDELGARVHLGGSLQAELAVLRSWDQAVYPVGPPLLGRGDGVLHGRYGSPHDRVGVAGGLGGVGPLREKRIADKADLGAADGDDLVWPGPAFAAIVLLVVALGALTAAEMVTSAGEWFLSVNLAPARRREHYL